VGSGGPVHGLVRGQGPTTTMTTRRPCPPAPGPLEHYATQFDPLLASVAQRRGFRDYLQGLLLQGIAQDPGRAGRGRADHRGPAPRGPRLQWFLSESAWDHQQVNDQRLQLWCQDPATAPQ
jgi:hypothetical protein